MLLLITAIFWARGYVASDLLDRGGTSWDSTLAAGLGRVTLTIEIGALPRSEPLLWLHGPYSALRRANWNKDDGILGFNFGRRTAPPPLLPGAAWYWVRLPDWFLCAFFSIVPIARLLRRNRNKERNGVCRLCGYDLRASPERCPECGEVPSRH